MDFSLTPQQQELQNAMIKFAQTELTDDIAARDVAGEFWREGWRRCAEFGVQGLPIAEAHGGGASDIVTVIAVMEGLGYGCPDQGLIFSINAHMWTCSIPIQQYGTPEQKAKYLPGLCDGRLIGGNSASEPESGSDVYAMHTRAARDGDSYVLNGTKMFVTNAQVADMVVVYATLNPEWGAAGVTAFLVEKGAPGFHIGKPLHKMGLRTSPMAELVFENCRIPVANRLGREGRGVDVFNCSMEWERSCILASCLGVMRRQLEQCIAYVRSRKQFGQSIGKFQSVANRIVDMKLRLETARMMVYQIGWLRQNGKGADLEAAMAKLYTSESFLQSCLDAVQIHGGYGYMAEFPFERELRDAVGSRIYSGTNEIQRNIIAKRLGL